jgi:hypothetical protein
MLAKLVFQPEQQPFAILTTASVQNRGAVQRLQGGHLPLVNVSLQQNVHLPGFLRVGLRFAHCLPCPDHALQPVELFPVRAHVEVALHTVAFFRSLLGNGGRVVMLSLEECILWRVGFPALLPPGTVLAFERLAHEFDPPMNSPDMSIIFSFLD